MINFNRIRINQKLYTPQNIEDLILDVHDEGDKDWVFAITNFLQDWFSEKQYIETQTSGSTGIPKNIQLPKTAMKHSALATYAFLNLSAGNNALLCLPVSYIAGKMMLVRALISGFNLTVVKPSSNPFWNIDTTIDFTAVTPHQLFESIETIGKHNIKKILVGGSAVSGLLESKLQTLHCEIYETYGMTETCSHIALRKLNGSNRSEYFTVLNNITIETDSRQCLVIHAPLLAAEKLITNDVVNIMEPQHFQWLGRIDNMINSGGIKLFPEQIERKIEPLLAGFTYFIGGSKDEKLGEKLTLLIEGKPFPRKDITTLKKQFKKILQPFEMPREIVFIGHFDRSESGKILKKKVEIRAENQEPRTKTT